MKTSLNKALKETKVLIHAVFATPLLYFKQTDIKINRHFHIATSGGNVAFWDHLHLTDQR